MSEYTTSIDIEAPPEVVFPYLTTNDGLTAWMGESADLNPIQGGRFAVDIAGYAIRGEFLEIEPPHKLVVTWGTAGSKEVPPGATRLEFQLTAIPTGTRVTLTHSQLPDTNRHDFAAGWDHFIPRLRTAILTGNVSESHWAPNVAPSEIVRAYHHAWTSGNLALAMAHIADDVVWQVPGNTFTGKHQYAAFLGAFIPTVVQVREIASFADTAKVMLLYTVQTSQLDVAPPVAEYFTVRNGKITENVLIFDRLSFSKTQVDSTNE